MAPGYLIALGAGYYRILTRQQRATDHNSHENNVAKDTVVDDVEAEDAESVGETSNTST